MNGKEIRPTTIVGIKRLAKSIRNSTGCCHQHALDLASRQASFTNYRNARSILGSRSHGVASQGTTIFLTAYWRERNCIDEGRETFHLNLGCSWQALIGSRELRRSFALDKFRGRAADHLVSKTLYRSQASARRALCSAARELQFMAITKLRPASARNFAQPWPSERLPGADHMTSWADPQSGLELRVDEPYAAALDEDKLARRAEWAAKHGYRILRASWQGMYAPDIGSVMFLVVHDSLASRADGMLKALDKAPAPVVEAQWQGESATYRPSFRSSLEIQQGLKATVPLDPLLCRATASTVVTGFGTDKTRRKPNGKMPVEVHEEIGALLKAGIGRCADRAGVSSRLDRVRSKLDNWLEHEYSRDELDSSRFFDVYYHGDRPKPFGKRLQDSERLSLLNDVDQVERTLKRHYPDCAPLRELIRQLHAARKSITGWSSERQ